MLSLLASVAVVLVPAAAGAQVAPPVEQRIDAVFENLPQNAAKLAVPLSRRALAKRASVLPYVAEEPSEVLEGFVGLEKPPAVPDAGEETATAPAAGEQEDVEEGSADSGEEPGDFRIPPPRPDPVRAAAGSIDLVAAPAMPSRPAQALDLVAAAAEKPPEQEETAAERPPEQEETAEALPLPRPRPERAEERETAMAETAPKDAVADADPAPETGSAQNVVTPVTEVAKAPVTTADPFPQPDPATMAALKAGPETPEEDVLPAADEDAPETAEEDASPAAGEDARQTAEEDAPETAEQGGPEELDDAPVAWVPPPRPDREGDASRPVSEANVVSVAARPSGPCLSPDKVADRDDDFSRNAEAFSGEGFCITQQKFKERKRSWTIQTVTSGKPGPLWALLHDDENESFDTAVHALETYGGVIVAVDTGGKRNQDGIDPNRNFSDDVISCAKLGESAAPKFTAVFKDLLDPSQPVIALHNNFDGPVSTKGLGHVSMTAVPKDMRKVASKDPDGPLAGEHSLVLLAALEPVEESTKTRMQGLAERGLNVVLEPVREGKGDCSLSNYAVLSGHENYFNVTVHHDEGEKQRNMIDAIMTGFPTVAASR